MQDREHYLYTRFQQCLRQSCLTVMLSLLALSCHGVEMKNEMKKLSDYQWKNRLVLVQSDSQESTEIEALREARAGIDDRDIVWFVNTGSDLVSNQSTISSSVEKEVTGLLKKSRADQRVLLIGKDGGIKSRESTLDLDAIFRRIDAMPMRMREMRSDKNVKLRD